MRENHKARVRGSVRATQASVITPVLPPITIGLTAQQVEEWRAKNGANVIPAPKEPPMIMSYLMQMANLFSFVLFFCGMLSIVVWIIDTSLWIDFYTGLLFWAVAFFNAGLEFWQSYSSAKTLQAFLNLVPASSLVVRDGQIVELPATEIVVGDLVLLKTGDKVPADLRIIWGDNVRVDNSSLTGESEPQERDAECCTDDALEARNILFSGTMLISGDTTALVIRTGAETIIGRLAKFAVTAPKRTSRLQQEITFFVRRLVVCAVCFSLLACTLGFSLGLYVTSVIDASVGVLVSFLPQGLPATMTILLTSAAKRMAARNVLVKELRSVETLGAMTLLATDKTGTLTQNKMAVVGGWIFGKIYNSVEDIDSAPEDTMEFLHSVALCTACKLDETEVGMSVEDRKIYGDATEVGILQCVGRHEDLEDIFSENEKVLELPFTSATKWHLTVYQLKKTQENMLIMKGAPERVLGFCKTRRNGKELLPVDEKLQADFQRTYEYFAAQGLRVLAVAGKKLPSKFPVGFKFEKDPINFPMDEMEFFGLICLRDPPKVGVKWAVERLRDAGIQVVMVTGDHPLTAEAISRQVSILTRTEVFRRSPTASDVLQKPHIDAVVIHGENVDSMSASDWKRITSMKEVVFARTAPRHKLEIVKQFQSSGHIVAVSGDGVNDSPALRKANLGISMNKTASDVSKDAAHMILLDDNFVSIVAGVFEGRLIFENLKKSIRYTLTHITSEVSALLLWTLLLIPPPVSPILLIFVDVFAELGPAVSFAGEPAEYDLMSVAPRQEVKVLVPLDRRINQALERRKVPQWMQSLCIKVASLFHLDSTGETLTDADMVVWVVFEGGVLNAMGAWGAWVLVLVVEGVPFSILYRSYLTYFQSDSPDLTLVNGTIATADDQTTILGRVQAGYYFAILIAQWFNVFAQKHRYRMPYGWDMLINWLTYAGIFVAMVVAAIVVYIPGLKYIFDTDIPPALSLAPPFTAGFLIILYEFVRRWLRNRGLFGGIPNPNVLKAPLNPKGVEAPLIPRARELSIVERGT